VIEERPTPGDGELHAQLFPVHIFDFRNLLLAVG
jgi:hypothetical protein